MNPEQIPQSVGWQLGADGVQNIVEHVERYCACEERRITLTNRAPILRSRAELSFLADEERRLAARLQHEPPPGDRRRLRRRAIYFWAVVIALTLAGFALTLLAFDPFRLGWKAWMYCAGIAVVTPFLVEKVLEHWNLRSLFRILAAVACTAALASLMILALIRGDLLATEGTTNEPAVTIDDSSAPAPPQPEEHNDFYAETVPLLRWAMVLLALSMELGAGLALYQAWRSVPDSSEDWSTLRNDLVETRTRMAMLVSEITGLEDEPGVFAASFWRDFYRALLTNAARNAIAKLLVLVLVVLAIPWARADSGGHLDLVIGLDLTRSVAVVGPDGKSEFQKNIDGVTKILAQIPAGTRVTIIGITDRSFAQPDILLSASVPADPGYFGERLSNARNQIVTRWKARTDSLTPGFPATDVVGVLFLASQIFDRAPPMERRILVLFSDMRNSTPALNLENTATLDEDLDQRLSQSVTCPDLRRVEVYVLGMDGARRSMIYWQKLVKFWSRILSHSGSVIRVFSPLREPGVPF